MTENEPVEPNDDVGGEGSVNGRAPTGDEPGDDGHDGGDDQESFGREYVHELREKAAAARVKAKRGDAAEDRLRAAIITATTSSLLADPTDLPWTADLADDDGWPDPDKIETAARELVEAKPHLGRVGGDVGQGQRGDDHDAVSLTDLLKSGV